jgi:hypothetical protein
MRPLISKTPPTIGISSKLVERLKLNQGDTKVPTIREVLTRFSFATDETPLNNMRGALRAVGADLRKTFDTTTIKDHVQGLQRVQDAGENVRNTFSNIAKGAALLSGAIAAVGVGVGIAFAGVQQTADYADKIKDTSDQLGIATNELQALGYVAQLSGSSADELSVSLRFLNKNAVESAQNLEGPAAAGFKKLGVSVKDANGNFKSSTQLLEEMADGFQRMPEGPERSALAMELLGKSGVQMVPLLSQGRQALTALKEEAYAMGAVLDEDALNAGAAFNDEMDRLKAVGDGVKNMLGAALLPMMTEWVSTIRMLIAANKEVIAQRLEIAVKFITDAFAAAWRAGMTLYDSITWLADKFGGLEKILKWVGFALLALGGMATLSAIGSAAMAIGGLIAAVLSLNAAAVTAAVSAAALWVATMAVPILIGLAIAAVVLAFEDIYTYMKGGKSVFGDWVKWVYGLFDEMGQWASKMGSKIFDALVDPIVRAVRFANDYIKEFFGMDKDASWLPDFMVPGKASGAKGLALNGAGANNDSLDVSVPWASMKAPIQPTPLVLNSAANGGENISLENNITVNANGLDEDAARRVVSEEVQKSQASLFRKAGQNSVRKNKE